MTFQMMAMREIRNHRQRMIRPRQMTPKRRMANPRISQRTGMTVITIVIYPNTQKLRPSASAQKAQEGSTFIVRRNSRKRATRGCSLKTKRRSCPRAIADRCRERHFRRARFRRVGSIFYFTCTITFMVLSTSTLTISVRPFWHEPAC